jgi:peptidoglycan/LPS O-acetylase OafA/YrhL
VAPHAVKKGTDPFFPIPGKRGLSPFLAPARGARLASLDALRGVAILLVLFHHTYIPAQWSGAAAPFARVAYRFGWTGVDLFFVLSGFLVGGLLLGELHERGTVDVRRFLVRRTFKIWPSYFALIGVVWLLTSTIDPPRDPAKAFKHIVPNLLHVQNYWISPRIQTWSLAIEEHFYLLLPFLLALIARRRRPGVPLAVLATLLLVGCLTLRIRLLAAGVTSATDFVFPTHLRLDSLFFGVLIAYVYRFHPQRLRMLAPWRPVLLALGLACVLPMAIIDLHFSPFVVTAGFSLLYLGYGALLVAAVLPSLFASTSTARSGRMVLTLAAVGRVSYPMYLWFFDVQGAFRHAGLPPFAPAWLVAMTGSNAAAQAAWWSAVQVGYVVVTVATGYLMTATVERPGLALRDRLFPRRSTALG